MYISIKDNFDVFCFLYNPLEYDDSDYPKSFTFNLLDFFNDITKINFIKLLGEMNKTDFQTLFVGNLEGQDIYTVDTKLIIKKIESNYFVGNKLSCSTVQLISFFHPDYKSWCSLYRAVLLLAKNNILCVFNKEADGKNNRMSQEKYAKLLLKNISREISYCPLPQSSTVYMIISDILEDLQSEKSVEIFYRNVTKLIESNLYPDFYNDSLTNEKIINPETVSFDEFLNKHCNLECKKDIYYDIESNIVSERTINKINFLYKFLTSSKLTELIRDEEFGREFDDMIALEMLPIEYFLSKDNNDIFTLDLAKYLNECYGKNSIQTIYHIKDNSTIFAKLFLFAAVYLKLQSKEKQSKKTTIKFRKCHICKHDYIKSNTSSNDKNNSYCFICRNNYDELINGYNKLFNNSIAPAGSRMSFDNKKIQDKWKPICKIIEKSKYYEIKKDLKDKILRLDNKVFSDEIKTELEFLEFPNEIGNHSLENLQYFYDNYLRKPSFAKLFDEESKKEVNDFIYNAKLILNKDINQEFFNLDDDDEEKNT